MRDILPRISLLFLSSIIPLRSIDHVRHPIITVNDLLYPAYTWNFIFRRNYFFRRKSRAFLRSSGGAFGCHHGNDQDPDSRRQNGYGYPRKSLHAEIPFDSSLMIINWRRFVNPSFSGFLWMYYTNPWYFSLDILHADRLFCFHLPQEGSWWGR